MEIRFEKTLRELMRDKGINQNELADFLGVKRSTITMYVNGKSYPEFRTLIKIAEFFDVSLDYLVTGERVENQTVRQELGLSETAVENLKDSACGVLLDEKEFHSKFSEAMSTFFSLKSLFEAKGKEFDEAKQKANLNGNDLLKATILVPAQIMRDYFLKFFAELPVWN